MKLELAYVSCAHYECYCLKTRAQLNGHENYKRLLAYAYIVVQIFVLCTTDNTVYTHSFSVC